MPFIARYRKEMTNTMNEETVADIKKRIEQLEELDKRKEFVLKSISEQEKLTPELEKQIKEAETMQDVEDLYLPYKPKRRTKAEIARQKGLEPLDKLIMSQNSDDVNSLAKRYINKEKDVNNEEEALKGACDINASFGSFHAFVKIAFRRIDTLFEFDIFAMASLIFMCISKYRRARVIRIFCSIVPVRIVSAIYVSKWKTLMIEWRLTIFAYSSSTSKSTSRSKSENQYFSCFPKSSDLS